MRFFGGSPPATSRPFPSGLRSSPTARSVQGPTAGPSPPDLQPQGPVPALTPSEPGCAHTAGSRRTPPARGPRPAAPRTSLGPDPWPLPAAGRPTCGAPWLPQALTAPAESRQGAEDQGVRAPHAAGRGQAGRLAGHGRSGRRQQRAPKVTGLRSRGRPRPQRGASPARGAWREVGQAWAGLDWWGRVRVRQNSAPGAAGGTQRAAGGETETGTGSPITITRAIAAGLGSGPRSGQREAFGARDLPAGLDL